MMISRSGRRAGPEERVLVLDVAARHGAVRQATFRDTSSGGGNVPDDPVQAVLGPTVERDVDVVQDDRVAGRAVGGVKKSEAGLHILAEARVPERHDSAVLESVRLDPQRHSSPSRVLSAMVRAGAV